MELKTKQGDRKGSKKVDLCLVQKILTLVQKILTLVQSNFIVWSFTGQEESHIPCP